MNAAVERAAPLRGKLLRRYKRFLADIETEGGRVLTVHCPDPGSMRGLLREGAAVRCSTSENPTRKLPHTLEMIRAGRFWVGVHTGRANAIARCALEALRLRGLAGYRGVTAEVPAGEGTRLDFRLSDHARGAPDKWLEVKSVSWAVGRRARFPDARTRRGTRHLETLRKLACAGDGAALLYVVQRADCTAVEPAAEVDPLYARALRDAADAGVELRALRARVTPTRIIPERALPVVW